MKLLGMHAPTLHRTVVWEPETTTHPTGPEGLAVLSFITQKAMFVRLSQAKEDENALKRCIQGGQ